MPFASAKQKRYLRWKRPEVYRQIAAHDDRVAKADARALADFYGAHDIYRSWIAKDGSEGSKRNPAHVAGSIAGGVATAVGTGAAIQAVQRNTKQKDAGLPLTRKGRRVRRKLARNEGRVVMLRPGQFRQVAEGQGWTGRTKSAVVARNMRWSRGGDRKGPTDVTVYSNRVIQHGGSHKAQARAMRGRRIPVRVVGVKEGMPATMPRFAAKAADKRAQMYRDDLKATTRMRPGRIKQEASFYRAGKTAVRTVLRKSEDEDRRRNRIAGAAGAAATGVAATTIPVRRAKPSAEARRVRGKITSPLRPGGRARLSAKEFAAINGGRGYRFSNDKYTARLAAAMGRRKVKQNRLVMDVYDDAVLQRDGAHRAHARAMLGRKIKVKAVRHSGPAPKHTSLVQRIGYDIARTRQARRLKKPKRTVRQLERYGGTAGPVSRTLTRAQARASQNAFKRPSVSPKTAGAVAAPVLLASGGTAAVLRHRQRERGVAKSTDGSSKSHRRAARVAEGTLPTGSQVGGLRVKGHSVDGRAAPTVVTEFDTLEGAPAGHAKTSTLPGKRYFVSEMKLRPEARGTGAGRQAQQQFVEHAKKSKDVRRAYLWAAGGSSRGDNGMSGARAWRADRNMRYMPGVGITSFVDKHRIAALEPKQRRRAKLYVARSRTGLARPHALAGDKVPRGLDAQTADALRNTAWAGSVKGGAPSRTGRAAVVGVAGYGAYRGAKAAGARKQAKRAVRTRNRNLAIGGGTTALAGGGAAAAAAGRDRR